MRVHRSLFSFRFNRLILEKRVGEERFLADFLFYAICHWEFSALLPSFLSAWQSDPTEPRCVVGLDNPSLGTMERNALSSPL